MTLPDFKAVFDFLNNQTVGAFLGGFTAFFLVVANDWRRERRKLKTLRAEIEVNRADAQAKLETARRMRNLMREANRVVPAPILRFNTTFTRQIASEVLHHLSIDQRRCVDALCYTMEAIDALLAECEQLSSRFAGPLGQAERIATAERLLGNWSDAITNLKRLMEMCDNYLLKKYTEVITKQYDPSQYEEP